MPNTMAAWRTSRSLACFPNSWDGNARAGMAPHWRHHHRRTLPPASPALITIFNEWCLSRNTLPPRFHAHRPTRLRDVAPSFTRTFLTRANARAHLPAAPLRSLTSTTRLPSTETRHAAGAPFLPAQQADARINRHKQHLTSFRHDITSLSFLFLLAPATRSARCAGSVTR